MALHGKPASPPLFNPSFISYPASSKSKQSCLHSLHFPVHLFIPTIAQAPILQKPNYPSIYSLSKFFQLKMTKGEVTLQRSIFTDSRQTLSTHGRWEMGTYSDHYTGKVLQLVTPGRWKVIFLQWSNSIPTTDYCKPQA